MCTSCLLVICIYALCPLTPKALHTIPTTLIHRGLLEGILGGLHCCSTCLKDEKHQGAVRAELFHEGEDLGAEEQSSTSHAVTDGAWSRRGLSQQAELGAGSSVRPQPWAR